ncbi:mitochondrial carrier [Rhizoclosmatium globosum]|uniref:Mitochondrial carrier n=1 Tax=Rhizoclosmatium globosum TaxID=329046 RepID=A0A1Y2B520_9FUNG|nr:mitochondrial carrier [Rhizoclosmatium globosum]|eukprot:ORY29923.1 mitochondrial carrier [Rhizoclosmatium globosum]
MSVVAPANARTVDATVAKTRNHRDNFWLHFMAGGIGGTVGASVTCPLEVVKTRMQSSLYQPQSVTATASAKFQPIRLITDNIKSVGTALKTIRQQEGIFALWKGLGPNLVGVVPARAIYFSSYNHGKQFYTSLNGGKETSIVHMLSAATAGMATALCTNPIWLVKTRMQLQNDAAKSGKLANAVHYKNSFHCAQQVFRTEGIRGLYKGLSASFLGLSESTLQFVLYEYFKQQLLHSKNEQARLSSATNTTGTQKNLEWFNTIGAAASAKLIAAIATYPHEVLRTRLRESAGGGRYTGLVQSAVLIYREEGMGGLYGGMTAHLLRVVPNACILFGTVEFILAVAGGNEK